MVYDLKAHDAPWGYSWGSLAPLGAPWRFLVLHGAPWDSLAPPWAPWRFLELPGAPWGSLALPGACLRRVRLRGFGPGAGQGSRIWVLRAPAFEDLVLGHARVQGFGAGAGQGSRVLGFPFPVGNFQENHRVIFLRENLLENIVFTHFLEPACGVPRKRPQEG